MQRYQPATKEQVEQFLEDTRASNGRSRGKKPRRTPWQIFRRILSTAIILALVVTLGVLLKTKLEGGYPELFGYRIFQVETGSMITTLPIGSIILIHEPADPYNLYIGTVITYRHETATVTHRIVDYAYIKDDTTGGTVFHYQTQGDNPENDLDPWTVAPEDILGEMVWHFSF